MRILVTCFEPFGGDVENASALAVTRLAATGAGPADVEVLTRQMSVAFGRGTAELTAAVVELRPDAILSVGEDGTSAVITVETTGVNRVNARIADNDGEQPLDAPIDAAADAPATRAASVDVAAVRDAMRAAGVPAELSDDAGRFLCNVFAYLIPGFGVPAVFLHVPALRTVGQASVGEETHPGRRPAPSDLTVDDLARGLRAALEVLAAQVRG